MNARRLVLAGIAGGVANAVYSMLVCTRLIIPFVKQVTPDGFWVPSSGQHIATMVLFGFAACLLWAFGYALLYRGIPGRGVSKGLVYGLLLWLLAILPNNAALHLHTGIWPEFNWVFLGVNNLLRWLLLGAVFALIYKPARWYSPDS